MTDDKTKPRDKSWSWRVAEGYDVETGACSIVIRHNDPPFFLYTINKDEFTNELYSKAIARAHHLANCAYGLTNKDGSSNVVYNSQGLVPVAAAEGRAGHPLERVEAGETGSFKNLPNKIDALQSELTKVKAELEQSQLETNRAVDQIFALRTNANTCADATRSSMLALDAERALSARYREALEWVSASSMCGHSISKVRKALEDK